MIVRQFVQSYWYFY